jgi:hypothetical protein
MGSGFKTFTAASVLTAADLNNFCQSQSVMYFATTAARDAAITSPVAGMVAFIDSGDANEGLYVYHGATGGWRKGPGWNAPWGFLATSGNTGSVTTGTHTTLQDGSVPMTLTATTITNRRYKITMDHQHYASGGANGIQRRLLVGGATQRDYFHLSQTVLLLNSETNVGYFNETSGQSRIFKVQIAAYNTNTAVNDNNFVLTVEDIGPSGAPA